MPHRLQSENESLRRQLQCLLHEARRNEEKLLRFDQFERRLIGTPTLAGVIRLLQADYKAAFELDVVKLVLVDPEYELTRFLESCQDDREVWADLQLRETGFALENFYQGRCSPVLAAFDARQHGFMFGNAQPSPASVALLPLVCQGRLIGSLNLGSHSPERFTADSGTQFLGRLAAVAAACLENALNHERLQLIGLTDPLTGVSNRRYFECRLEEEAIRSRRHGLPLACMFIDIDRFKRINDSLGHRTGDQVLSRVASLIKAQLRGCDILARYGGEEFVILLPQTAIHHARDIAERIRAAVAANPFALQSGDSLPVTVSLGVSSLPEGRDEGDCGRLAARLVEQADQAVYKAKQGGRNRVVSELDRPRAQPAWMSFFPGALEPVVRRFLAGQGLAKALARSGMQCAGDVLNWAWDGLLGRFAAASRGNSRG